MTLIAGNISLVFVVPLDIITSINERPRTEIHYFVLILYKGVHKWTHDKVMAACISEITERISMKFGTGIYNNISSANLILIHTGAMKQKSNFIDLKRGGGILYKHWNKTKCKSLKISNSYLQYFYMMNI